MAKITALSFIVPVRDLERAVTFYKQAFGLEEVFRNENIVFVAAPGTESALGVLRDPEHAGSGPQNVGFHVDHAEPPEAGARDVESAGGRILERGEHAPGVPFARIADPDENELWI
jgi:predicted enzyme related to lactoylglutathione lyase